MMSSPTSERDATYAAAPAYGTISKIDLFL